MKITIIGNHCTWTKQACTSFMVNDDTLVDISHGNFKLLYNDYDLTNIKNVIITHFHSDHFLDIFLLIDVFFHKNKKLTIIAPSSCKERMLSLIDILEVQHLKQYIENDITFVEVKDGQEINLDNYKIKCFQVVHGHCLAFGYTICSGKAKIGFSGDTILCAGLENIIKNCDSIFLDTTADTKPNKNHIPFDDIELLQHKYPSTSFYAVHLRKDNTSQEDLPYRSILTTQGQVLNFE